MIEYGPEGWSTISSLPIVVDTSNCSDEPSGLVECGHPGRRAVTIDRGRAALRHTTGDAARSAQWSDSGGRRRQEVGREASSVAR